MNEDDKIYGRKLTNEIFVDTLDYTKQFSILSVNF